LIDRDNKISYFREELEKTAEQLGKTFEQLGKTTEELDKTTEELGKTTEQLDKTTEELGKTTEELGKATEELETEKNKTKYLQLAFAKALKANGFSIELIQKETGLPNDEIEEL
jgi:methyl-accepting chemotaxis protein